MGHPVFLNKDHLLTFTYITTITNTISVISTIITITNTFISVISTIIVTNTTITNTVLSAPSSSPSPPSLTPSSVLSAPSSSPPVYLVPRSRFGGSRRKKGGGGGGGGERRKRDLAKYDCVGQNLAHASTAHARSLTCFQVYSTNIEFDTALRFALKNAVL